MVSCAQRDLKSHIVDERQMKIIECAAQFYDSAIRFGAKLGISLGENVFALPKNRYQNP